MPAWVGDQRRRAKHRQQEQRMAKPAMLTGEDGRRERGEMVGQVGKVTGSIVEGASDDQKRVISSSLGGFPRALLPVEYLVVRDHSCSVPKDHA